MKFSTPAGLIRTLLTGLALTGACASDDTVTGSTNGANVGDGDEDGDGDKPSKGDAGTGGKTPVKSDAGKPDTDKPVVKPDDGVDKCAGIRQDAPAASGGVDVVFIIDTSGSMLHAITQVTANIAKFVQDFEGSAADTRVVMITGDDPASGTPVAEQTDKYRFISSEVDSGRLYQVATQRYPEYKDFLRPTAALQFVMITDDNDRIAPAMFKQSMSDLLGGRPFTQHAVASESVNGGPCISEAQLWNPLCAAPIPSVCAAAAVGDTYYSLADDTGGEKLSICKADWSGVFSELKQAVIAAVPLPCSYPLSGASTKDFDANAVQVVYTPEGGADDEFPRANSFEQCSTKLGWYYDDPASPKVVNLCPAACEAVAQGGSMDIAFGCEPIVFL